MPDEPRGYRSRPSTLEALPEPVPDVTDDDLLPLDEPDVRIDESDAWRVSAPTTVGP